MLDDLRLGIRHLTRAPGFTLGAMLTLSIGLGATAAMFSVLNGVVLQPLPYDRPDELVFIRSDVHGRVAHPGLSGPEILTLRERAKTLADLGGLLAVDASLTAPDSMQRVQGASVSHRLVEMLGVQPFLGRHLRPEDNADGRAGGIVVSHRLWRSALGGDPDVLNRPLEVNNSPRRVVGVLPAGFEMHLDPTAAVPPRIDIFFHFPEEELQFERDWRGLAVIGRLQPGIDRRAAQVEMDLLAAQIAAEHPASYRDGELRFRLADLRGDAVSGVRPAILALMAAVGLLLLIACADVAALFIARATARRPEMAIRRALGASRSRLLRQIAIESLLVSIASGAIGLLLAAWGVEALLLLVPEDLPRQREIALDGSVFTATFLLATVAGLGLALLTGRHAERRRAEVTNRSRRGERPALDRLVTVQLALTLALLIGTGLMVRTADNLARVDVGFRADDILLVSTEIRPENRSDLESRWRLYDRALDAIGALPGVIDVSGATHLPMVDTENVVEVADAGVRPVSTNPEGATNPELASIPARFTPVLPGYFRTLGIALERGRPIDRRDNDDSRRIAVVDRRLAERLWGDGDPIGRRVRLGNEDEGGELEVVGVAATVRDRGLRRDGEPAIYLPYRLMPTLALTLTVRTDGDPMALASSVKTTFESISSRRPAHDLRGYRDVVDRALAPARFVRALLGTFAVIAIVLAAVGLFGVVSYAVRRRDREIGVRVAVGATRFDILGLVARFASRMLIPGLLWGILGGWIVGRLLASELHGVATFDAATYATVTALIVAVAGLSIAVPARRATDLDAADVLRRD